jgi:hypothetical protein
VTNRTNVDADTISLVDDDAAEDVLLDYIRAIEWDDLDSIWSSATVRSPRDLTGNAGGHQTPLFHGR